MGKTLLEHLSGIVVVTVILAVAVVLIERSSRDDAGSVDPLAAYGALPSVDLDRAFDRALLIDVLGIYYPGRDGEHREAVAEARRLKSKKLGEQLQRAHLKEELTGAKLADLGWMYAKFLFVFVLVMFLTYYGVQTIGVWWFVRRKQEHEGPWRKRRRRIWNRLLLTPLKAAAYFVLFSPAYVIAYSIRTEFSTDTLPFLVVLGVISNGLLITYANKFYTFLVSESRKGYVETAIAKNLSNSYDPHEPGGIPLRAILRPVKRFDGHVFGHIFRNARFQYLATIKEQSTFLVTGLIIIEMALNIHGYLSYEMLRQMLYRNHSIVITIILGIFYAVKLAEITTDIIIHRESARYANRA